MLIPPGSQFAYLSEFQIIKTAIKGKKYSKIAQLIKLSTL
jgi:hypothetical protein